MIKNCLKDCILEVGDNKTLLISISLDSRFFSLILSAQHDSEKEIELVISNFGRRFWKYNKK